MKNYTVETIQSEFAKKGKIKCLFFWGHTATKNGVITQSCLSQWWPSPFTISGVDYVSAEQYMMAEKARLFGDEKIREQILSSANPKKIKSLGRIIHGFDETVWKMHRVDIVIKGNLNKFCQNEQLKEFLLRTGNKLLVEASPVDKIWGIGLSADDPKVKNPYNWKGENLLGYALMHVREELITLSKNTNQSPS